MTLKTLSSDFTTCTLAWNQGNRIAQNHLDFHEALDLAMFPNNSLHHLKNGSLVHTQVSSNPRKNRRAHKIASTLCHFKEPISGP